MGYEILGVCWFTASNAFLGVVAVHTGMHDPERREWKAYLGTAAGFDPEADKQFIAARGAPLMPEQAQGFFPHLDIAKYKES